MTFFTAGIAETTCLFVLGWDWGDKVGGILEAGFGWNSGFFKSSS